LLGNYYGIIRETSRDKEGITKDEARMMLGGRNLNKRD
jgi:hypothetical protein